MRHHSILADQSSKHAGAAYNFIGRGRAGGVPKADSTRVREASVQTLDVMIARLRLMLADLAAKESSYEALRRQYHEQRKKIISYTLYSETTLDTSLGLLRDLDERLAEANADLDRLSQIRRKAESELESLQLTRGVEQAKAELAKLQQRRETEAVADPQAPSDELEEQIRRLQALINEASDRAARNIGGAGPER